MVTADIPLNKLERIRPFISKYCKQGGSLPQQSTLRQVYLPRLFSDHHASLVDKFVNKPIAIILDETTDVRDHSILNIMFSVYGEVYLVDCVTMGACNHSTVSQAVVKTVTDYGIEYNNVMAVVTDSAAYCKKAYKDVLSGLFPQSTHVPCLAHIINLVGEIFLHWPSFNDVHLMCSMMKSAFFKKPQRKRRFLEFLSEYLPPNRVHLPPEPVRTRWGTWFAVIKYHTEYIHLYEGFFKSEKSEGVAVESLLEITRNKDRYKDVQLQMAFIVENCHHIMNLITYLEGTHFPLAAYMYNKMEEMRAFLLSGTTKLEFGIQTDIQLSKYDIQARKKYTLLFNKIFQSALDKFEKHIDHHPAMDHYKSTRLFNPVYLPAQPKTLDAYPNIPEFSVHNQELLDEFNIYTHLRINSEDKM
ncbi:hypothetical protein SNE40_005140 [Patella caerulea]